MMLLIYVPFVTARTEYIFSLIFKNELGIPFRTTSDIHIFNAYEGEKINYSYSRNNDEFFIQASGLLFENSIHVITPDAEEKYGIKILFANHPDCSLGFDIFSAAFFMVSRYEEYLPYAPDKHGRFKAADSTAFKNNFLDIPVVDIWINKFKDILQNKFQSLQFLTSHFKAIVTYDIDVAYKYKGRSFTRNAGSALKDILKLDFRNIYNRIQTLVYNKKDPWDVYDYLQKIIEQNRMNSIFFFLLGDNSKHDRNLDFKNPVIKKLVNKIKSFSEFGIHPSYKTSVFPEKIVTEKKRLENLSGKNIYKSRQHFLKFTLPDTYNSLVDAGITEDYSMGFAGKPGFRAGTSKPFYFYDLKNEKLTTLKIFPITFMESSLVNNGDLDGSDAFQKIVTLLNHVKNVGGIFISLWHNQTVCDTDEYRAWKSLHDEMIRCLL
jgi:hypothetical protein